jgi:hypothetical protein
MTPQARAELLMSYAQGPRLLQEALERYPAEALEFTPGPGRWSLRTIVFHLAESEVHGYLRARTIIAEPGSPVVAYDQDLWARSFDEGGQPVEEAVTLFRLLREMLARQLRSLPEEAWARTMLHPERGAVTLERWLELYEGHLTAHLGQMERTWKAWRAS